jgi:glycosyltransferase involved in cell wall biosynthesis
VPTEWGRDVLVHSGLARQRVRVVPYGVDTNRFVPGAEPPDRSKPFRFLCVGKWERRKGQEELVRAFCRAFDPATPVELYLHCHNPYRPGLDLESLVRSLVAEEGGGPPIHLGAPRSDDQLVRLYQSADAFVLPTRGEGWGLPILEAMACGLPVLVTDHPAVRTFANPPHAHLIRARSVPVDDPMYFDPDLDWGEWLEPDPDHLVDLLRLAFEDRTTLRPAGRAARREALHWTWDAAAGIAHQEIRNLRGSLGDLHREMAPQMNPVEERQCA